MTPLKRLVLAIPLMAALSLIGSPAPGDETAIYSGEVGVLAGHHDNFFFRGRDQPAPASDLLSAYVQVEREQEIGRGEWTFGVAAEIVEVADIDRADYQGLDLAAEYKRGPWKGSLAVHQLLNRLYSESGEAVYFDELAFDAWVRYSVTPRLWVRARAEWAEQDFDPQQNARDADVTDYSATARYALTPALGLRASLLFEDRQSLGPDNNRTGEGVEVALEGTPTPRLSWFLRFRTRDRDYDDAPPGDSNFQRSDTVEDVNANVRWLFARRMGLQVRNSYRSGDSNRADRNFSGHVIEAGVFFSWNEGPED